MNTNYIASILYDYVVDGWTMEDIADDNGITTGEVSALVRSYGFNYQKQGSYRSGQHRGAYKSGYRCTYAYGSVKYQIKHTVIKQDLVNFVNSNRNASLDYPCNPDAFGDYLDKYVIPKEAEAIIRKQKQEQLEQQRRAEERRRQAEAEQRRIAEEQRRRKEKEEYLRRSEEIRRQLEAAQRQREEEQRRKAEEEQRRQKTFYALFEKGKRQLEANRISDALSKFRQAESMYYTNLLNTYIAYSLAKSPNSSEFAREICDRINKAMALDNYQPGYNDYYFLAKAYLALNDKNNACDNFFYAGDIAYDQNDFALADKTYTECLEKQTYTAAI